MEHGEQLRLFVAALDALSIRYLVGGSVASSFRSLPRATLDLDLLVELRADQTEALISHLGSEWYADADHIRDALARSRPFNVIHIRSGVKIDVFPVSTTFHRSELDRATVADRSWAKGLRFASSEDIMLAKLQWYRQGGEISERQWTDIVTLLQCNPHADRAYLEHWAATLGVLDLLQRAFADTAR